MSALARYFNSRGKQVFGYDKHKSDLCQKLEEEGMQIIYTDKENICLILLQCKRIKS